MFGALKNGVLEWMFQWRGPERGTIVLVQRRVFILPSQQGLLFGSVIVLMLIGSVNYDLSLGFILSFLLGATGIQSMLHTFRNLANLRIAPGKVQPVFAGEQAQFQIRISNEARLHRYSVGVTRDRLTAVYVDVPPGEDTVATVAITAVRRGWLRPGRLTLFTFFRSACFVPGLMPTSTCIRWCIPRRQLRACPYRYQRTAAAMVAYMATVMMNSPVCAPTVPVTLRATSRGKPWRATTHC